MPVQLRNNALKVISNITGYDTSDLDMDMTLISDLGIDSIKQINIVQGVIQLLPTDIQAAMSSSISEKLLTTNTLGELLTHFEGLLTPLNGACRSEGTKDNREQLATLVLSQISEVSGHEISELTPDLRLNQDLGIDSIKSITLLGHIAKQLPTEHKQQFEGTIAKDGLSGTGTISELTKLLTDVLGDNKLKNLPANTTLPQMVESATDIKLVYAQYQHLISQFAMDSSSLCSIIELDGALDLQHLKHAWQQLVARHPALRLKLASAHDAHTLADLKLEEECSPLVPDIALENMQSLSTLQQSEALQLKLKQYLMRQWDACQWPLHAISVCQTDSEQFHLFLSINHLIADGLSNQIILRELLALYEGLVSGCSSELPEALSMADYIASVHKMNSADDGIDDSATLAFIQQQESARFNWHPSGTKEKSSGLLMSSCPLHFSRKQSDKLKQAACNIGISLNSLLVSALLKSVNRLTGDNYAFLNVPTSGRIYDDINILHAVGDYAQNIVLEFNCKGIADNFAPVAKYIHNTIQSALGCNHDHSITKQLANAAKNIPFCAGAVPEIHKQLLNGIIKSNLYLSFVGDSGIRGQYANLTLKNYHPATVTVRGGLDNLIEQFDGHIIWSINYDSSVISSTAIDTYKTSVLNSIDEILAQAPTHENKNKETNHIYSDAAANQVQAALKETLYRDVALSEFKLDMERDLGMNSLRRINFVSRLRRRVEGVDASEILKCRQLSEVAALLSPVQINLSTQLSMHRVVAEQCKLTPNAIAISEPSMQLTFQELHLRSNRLAHSLRNNGLKPNELMGILMERSADMIVAILATLKAGGAYLPIDPSYPVERISYILNHSKSVGLLSHSGQSDKLDALAKKSKLPATIYMDTATTWLQESEADLTPVNAPDDLMTVLYTSGSTGNPKGVMLAHAGYLNRINWMREALKVTENDRIAFKTSCGFDISVWEIFLPLISGATLFPVEREIVTNPWALSDWINKNGITVMHFVPSLFGEFLTVAEDDKLQFSSLRWLIFSGEALPIGFIRRWFNAYGEAVKLANLYGPTEASIDVTAHFISGMPAADECRIPIGKPLPNTHILILDNELKPCQEGEIGELYIAGIQLAKGYLDDPEKSAAAFINNPFPNIPGDKIYRSGDLASITANGDIDYHGRIDSQVKIRGFRVELGEVEAVLQSYHDTAEAVVFVNQRGEDYTYLQALVHTKSGSLDLTALRDHATKKLPEYMIPAEFELLQIVPHTHNGKIDRKALMARYKNTPESGVITQQPDTAASCALAPAQRWLKQHFGSPYRWSGVFSFQYLDSLDHIAFGHAIIAVTERHSALRTVFNNQGGNLRQTQVTHYAGTSLVKYLDGSHLDDDQLDHKLTELITTFENELNIYQWPLWRIACVKESDSKHTIVIVGHHMICDMLSSSILFRDIWQAYNNILMTGSANLEPEQGSVIDLVNLLEEADRNSELDTHIEYWQTHFPTPHARFQVPLDFVRGRNSESSTDSVTVNLGQALTAELLTTAQSHYGVHTYPLLLAPLYKALGEWSGSQWVAVSHRTHGRATGSATHYLDSVGNFAVNYPLAIEFTGEGGFTDLVPLISQKMNAVPMAGVSYDYLSDRLPSHCYPDHNLTSVRANFLGDRTLPDSALFNFNEENFDRRLTDADSERTTLIELIFSIINNSLVLQISYSNNLHRQETIEYLARRWCELIDELLRETKTQLQKTTFLSACN